MKRFKKILIGLALLIILVSAAAFIYLRHIAGRAVPYYNQNITLESIIADVTVYRDDYGVPHVYAENEADLYRAVGYITAQDRLWQMDLMRRATTGRLAEIFGEELLETDLLMRSLRITEKSKHILKVTDEKILDSLDAFADGVNQYIEKNKDKLPPEFTILGYDPEKWQPYHSVNLAGYMAWNLTFAWSTEVLLQKIAGKVDKEKFNQLMPDLALHNVTVHRGQKLPELNPALVSGAKKLAQLVPEVFSGSNNWAVSGKKSITGKPVLANDMHLGFFIPGTWYQIHQTITGKLQLNATGVLLPGQPFIIAGHNERIAWGMTNVMADDLDFYIETINPQNPHQYKFNGEWKNMEVRLEQFKIRGSKTIEKELRFTHRGPIVSRFHKLENEEKEEAKALSMRWIGNEYSNELQTIYLLNRAGNWADFSEAVSTFIAVSQNIAYADVDGNIGIRTCAGIPIRKGNGVLPMPGDTDEYDWTGTVPFEELPYSYNPPCGYVLSANNKTIGNDYPYYISNWFFLPHRAERIRDMLEKKEKLSLEDFKNMQADVTSTHAWIRTDMLPILEQTNDLKDIEKQALELLAEWDGTHHKDSAAAAVFQTLYLVMLKNLIHDELDHDLYNEYMDNKVLGGNLMLTVLKDKKSPWCDDVRTPVTETFKDWIQSSFKETVRQLQVRLGEDPHNWQWGKIHRLTLKHPLGRVKLLDILFNLNRGPFETGGSIHTICPYSYSFLHPTRVLWGPSHRHLYPTNDWNRSQSVIPTGISGIPAAAHYCDQTNLFLENRYHNDFFTLQRVAENSTYKMTIHHP